ncbi:FERM domain-containing protein [Meloidogyne graminicola]|uniref:FERM domain-containing protein n=1 Tax=Meloidogyne graminicola TaxID=189291 RepID=A0A8S9ZWM1_9BILA|nr:FERM domain-containing protein [Meloidogyne graminicola]
MYLLTLNIECHEIGVKKTMHFEPRTLVHDACRMIRDKLDPLSGNPNDYGLFRVEDDQTKCVWMENGRTLEYYLIRNGDTLEYKNKIRSLRIRTSDGGAVKTIFVDESQPISQLMVVICSKMGIANHEEYSLVRGFSITFDGTDENSYGHGQHHQIQRNDRERTPYANGIDQHLYEGEIRGHKGKGVLENAFMNTIGRKKEKQIQQLRVKLHTEEEIHWVDHSKTLLEQNIGDDEELTLRRKFFFSDTNVDTRDPVQLNLLYIQCRGGVLRGFHPVGRDTAIRLAALQCYIEYGPFEEGIQKNVDLKNLLPKEYSRAKELEKNIIQEYRELIYEDSAAPKKKYCELCQSLPTMVEDIVAPAMDAHEECQLALVETIEATIRAVEEAEEEIVKPHIDLPRFGETQRHWRVEVKKESVGDRLAAMGAATSEFILINVVQLTAIPEESTVDTRLGNATATIGSNLPEMGRGVRELAALMPDEHRVDELFNEDSKFFNVFGNFLDKVHPEHQEKRANILSPASRVGELSNDFLSTIQDRTKDEISFYDEFEMKVQPLATSTPHLFLRQLIFNYFEKNFSG